mgnify:CR=1 FL=1
MEGGPHYRKAIHRNLLLLAGGGRSAKRSGADQGEGLVRLPVSLWPAVRHSTLGSRPSPCLSCDQPRRPAVLSPLRHGYGGAGPLAGEGPVLRHPVPFWVPFVRVATPASCIENLHSYSRRPTSRIRCETSLDTPRLRSGQALRTPSRPTRRHGGYRYATASESWTMAGSWSIFGWPWVR